MQFLRNDKKITVALFITGILSFVLTLLPTDNIYKAMERSTSYYTEDFAIQKDLDNDGIDEFIENQSYSDGGHVCSVYKMIKGSLYVGYVTDLLDKPYDEYGIGNMMTYYDRQNNCVFFIYKADGISQNIRKRLDISKIEFVPLNPLFYDYFDFGSFVL